jgi:ADP-heptose:LPS heptosyltransferase
MLSLKIALKLPDDPKQTMACFPLIHGIKEFLDVEHFHIVGTKDSFEMLKLLPFKAYFHEFDLENYQNFLDIHRFSVNQLDLSHADVFFSLTLEPKDHFMTMTFRGKDRVGFEGKWSSLFLNKKSHYPEGIHESDRFFSVLKHYKEDDLGAMTKIEGKKHKPPMSDIEENPYIMIDLPYDPINNEVPPDWVEFLDFCDDKQVFISCWKAPEEQRKIVLQGLINKLEKPVQIHPFYFSDLVEFSQMASYSKGVITDSRLLGEVAAYSRAKTIMLYDKLDPQVTAPFYFQGPVNIHSTSDMTLLKKVGDAPSEDKLTKFDLGLLFDKALKVFSL